MRLEKTAQVVIGAQFGDEGKGRLIDHYAALAGGDSIVIRFNGGAQAGHTVVTPEGQRHVFSHVGSGAFAGAATFLSRFFVANPILLLKEMKRLAEWGVTPTVLIDPASPATTPYDMMINQMIERERGDGRHGSCGIGFGETLERNLNPVYALTVGDLADEALADRLDVIRRHYAPNRLARLGFGDACLREAGLFQSDAILERYVEDVRCFLSAVTVMDARAAIQGRQMLFEGAQGLLLDQERGFFPYVTRSHTGLRNVLALAGEWGLERLAVTYATRAYLTRHGAGPLPGELPEKPYPGVTDPTNIPNDYQGTLRFAWLDLDLLGRAIAADLSDVGRVADVSVNPRLAITCLDQLGDGPAIYCLGGRSRQAGLEPFVAIVTRAVGINSTRLGLGPDRDSVRNHL
jgi:adenylosuccinate synthase